MKKVFLAAIALMGTYGTSEANVLTVNNLTGCTYTLSIAGGGIVSAPPGVSIVNSIPGLDITSSKIAYWSGTTILAETAVGLNFPYGNTMGQPTPPCLAPGAFFTASWAQASVTANATLVIF